jgi:dTDP-4-dehydrorhamnose 3,5-epimerase
LIRVIIIQIIIKDVELRDLQVNADERGHLVETFREDWDMCDPKPEMSYYSLSYPGVVRAWHRHVRGQVDHFVCPKGRIKVGIYDERNDSPTEGELDTFVIGEHNQQAIRIPGDCWHGFKVVGNEQAMLLNFPTQLYDYEDPDEERIPYDTDRIPLDWDAEPHK